MLLKNMTLLNTKIYWELRNRSIPLSLPIAKEILKKVYPKQGYLPDNNREKSFYNYLKIKNLNHWIIYDP